MNTIREIEKINKEELDRRIAGTSASWHTKYSKSAWVYIGNLDHELTEGDIICVMSQYGEVRRHFVLSFLLQKSRLLTRSLFGRGEKVEDIHLAREEDTGKSRGFAFLKYEDARSCVLAVDNFIGVQVGYPCLVWLVAVWMQLTFINFPPSCLEGRYALIT